MASRKSFLAKPNYIYPASSDSMAASDALFEFDESEIWTNSNSSQLAQSSMEGKKVFPVAREPKKLGTMRKISTAAAAAQPMASASLPVNIPDWSKILKDDYKDHRKIVDDDLDDDGGSGGDGSGDAGDRIPPHEYLARTRGASLSVHEGVGRTLKGRDLRRVRNAIWKKVGFED